MTFRAGLLQARGQIVFIVALAVSTAVIIRLESLDTDSRIRSRFEESRERGSIPTEVPRERAAAALRRAEEAYARAPNTSENRAAVLAALAGAVLLGTMERGQAAARVEDLLRAVEADPAPTPPVLAAALSATAAAFPALQERIGRLPMP